MVAVKVETMLLLLLGMAVIFKWCRRQCLALEIVVQMAVQMMLENGNGEGVGGVVVSEREFSGGGSLLVQMKLLIRHAFRKHVRHLTLPVQYLSQRRLYPLRKIENTPHY
jgi:hypothetical protein